MEYALEAARCLYASYGLAGGIRAMIGDKSTNQLVSSWYLPNPRLLMVVEERIGFRREAGNPLEAQQAAA